MGCDIGATPFGVVSSFESLPSVEDPVSSVGSDRVSSTGGSICVVVSKGSGSGVGLGSDFGICLALVLERLSGSSDVFRFSVTLGMSVVGRVGFETEVSCCAGECESGACAGEANKGEPHVVVGTTDRLSVGGNTNVTRTHRNNNPAPYPCNEMGTQDQKHKPIVSRHKSANDAWLNVGSGASTGPVCVDKSPGCPADNAECVCRNPCVEESLSIETDWGTESVT